MLFGKLLRRRHRIYDLQTVSQPLYCGTGDKYAAFQSIINVSINSPGDSRQQTGLTEGRASSRIHQEKATGAICILGHALYKAGLTKQGRLLVARHAGNGNFLPFVFQYPKIS